MDWAYLASRADRPDVQLQIREAIKAGLVRLVPDGDGVRIIPAEAVASGAMRGAHAA